MPLSYADRLRLNILFENVDDELFGNRPVDVPLEVILGKPPRLTRDVRRLPRAGSRRKARPGRRKFPARIRGRRRE